MINLKVKTPSGTVECDSPSTWDEMQLQTLVKMETEWDRKDPVKLFSIITGIDHSTLCQSKQRKLEEKLYGVVEFVYLNQPEWETMKCPNQITIDDTPYSIPDVAKATLAQKIMFDQFMANSENLIGSLADILAIYMQPIIDSSDFNLDRAMEIKDKINKCNAIEAYGVGLFFFLQIKSYRKNIMLYWLERMILKMTLLINRLRSKGLRRLETYS